MKNRFLFCAILLVCSSILINVTANEHQNTLVEAIIAMDKDCILGCVEDRVYLNPEKIIPSDRGLFLDVQNENYVPLPMIFSDESGCYIRPVFDTSIYNKCPGCGESYFITCKNSDCPLKARAKAAAEEKERKKQEYKENKQAKKKAKSK